MQMRSRALGWGGRCHSPAQHGAVTSPPWLQLPHGEREHWSRLYLPHEVSRGEKTPRWGRNLEGESTPVKKFRWSRSRADGLGAGSPTRQSLPPRTVSLRDKYLLQGSCFLSLTGMAESSPSPSGTGSDNHLDERPVEMSLCWGQGRLAGLAYKSALPTQLIGSCKGMNSARLGHSPALAPDPAHSRD